jgi:hypothetical protein
MKSKAKQPAQNALKKDPLTRSARMRLMRSVDFLIAHFESEKDDDRDLRVEPTQSKLLDRQYQRLCDSAAALNRWHADASYLTEAGAPKPISKLGKLSLVSLALEALGDSDRAQQTASDLIEFGMVRKVREKYVPDRRSAVLDRRSPLILAHATSAVTRYIDTVAHNVSGKKPSRYERHVADAQIALKDLPQFLRFVEQQGQYFIDAIDDWLSTRSAAIKPSDETTTVGIGAFAFAEAPRKIKAAQSSASARPRRSR